MLRLSGNVFKGIDCRGGGSTPYIQYYSRLFLKPSKYQRQSGQFYIMTERRRGGAEGEGKEKRCCVGMGIEGRGKERWRLALWKGREEEKRRRRRCKRRREGRLKEKKERMKEKEERKKGRRRGCKKRREGRLKERKNFNIGFVVLVF